MLRSLCLAVVFLPACASNPSLTSKVPISTPIPHITPIQKTELKIDAELEKEIARIAAEAKGKVGVAAVLVETGDAAFLNADQQFPMQSVYKLPIAMAVMERVKRGELNLDDKIAVTREDFVRTGMASPLRDNNPNGGEFTIRELIRLSLVESDGTASDVQMRLLGGASEVQSYLSQIGITDMKVVNTEKEIGRDWETQYENWSTPFAAAELLRSFNATRQAEDKFRRDNPSRTSVDVVNGFLQLDNFMVFSRTGPKRLKGLLPDTVKVAHKTGTSGTRNGITAATNDIGIIDLPDGKHIAVAVFVSDSPADEKTREAVIAKIARAVLDRWQNQPRISSTVRVMPGKTRDVTASPRV